MSKQIRYRRGYRKGQWGRKYSIYQLLIDWLFYVTTIKITLGGLCRKYATQTMRNINNNTRNSTVQRKKNNGKWKYQNKSGERLWKTVQSPRAFEKILQRFSAGTRATLRFNSIQDFPYSESFMEVNVQTKFTITKRERGCSGQW